MATRKKSALEEERMTPTNLDTIIKMLESPPEGEKAWSKKDCCQYLGIAYNTTRLGTLIEKHKEKKAATQARRAALRGKPATPQEIQFIISSYLEGETVSGLAERSYRSAGFINQILEAHAVPLRAKAHDYFKPELIPEAAMQTRFKLEEVVYSARYDSVARIKSELFQRGQWVYCVWLMSEKQQQFAYQEAAELASLEHLRKLGVQI